jgi:TatA/E family protein of Tat protein translocase
MVFFGGKKIPELMHGLGKGINEFKRGTQGGEDPAKVPEAPKAKVGTEYRVPSNELDSARYSVLGTHPLDTCLRTSGAEKSCSS